MNISQIANKAFTSSSPIQNYKELYLETKKNVALFISQVDQQITKVLKKHQKQISDLKRQNLALKQQLKGQSTSLFTSNNNSSLKERRSASTTKTYSHEKIKDFIDCELSNISLAQSKSIFTEKKKNSIISYILQDKDEEVERKKQSKQKNTQKSNSMTKLDKQNIWNEGSSELISLKSKLNVSKRAKKTNSFFMNDHQDVKGVLKVLREKANTPITYEEILRREAQEKPKNIIDPSMFNFHR